MIMFETDDGFAKCCSRCKRTFEYGSPDDLSEMFSQHESSPDGYQTYCRDCAHLTVKAAVDKKPLYYQAYRRHRWDRASKWAGHVLTTTGRVIRASEKRGELARATREDRKAVDAAIGADNWSKIKWMYTRLDEIEREAESAVDRVVDELLAEASRLPTEVTHG
jgi:late competence protein required for DNA uptake (superfamily II DNA/RNA helicase)